MTLKGKSITRKAIALSFGAVALGGILYEFPYHTWTNQRFSQCLSERLSGSNSFGILTDAFNKSVIIDPIIEPHGMDMLGRRAGAIIPKLDGKDTLTYSLEKQNGKYVGKWDFTRVAGYPLPTGTWGRSDVVPSPHQLHVSNLVQFCANSEWVNSNTMNRLPRL